MENFSFKIKLTVLWVFMAVAMSAAMSLALMAPGIIEELIAGEMEGMQISEGWTYVFSVLWLIPLTTSPTMMFAQRFVESFKVRDR